MSGNIQKILGAVVLLVALFFAYRFFFAGGTPLPALKIETAASSASAQAGKDFLVALINLQNINLDIGASVFKDDAYSRLKDMSVSLPDEPQGRPNPFKPIGDDSSSGASSAANSSQTAAKTSSPAGN